VFVGHYGVSFGAKRLDDSIPIWVLFLAVQLLDVVWAPLVLLGVERVRIVPGITASNPLDLYYMPYTHSLLAALVWSVVGAAAYALLARPSSSRSTAIIGFAIFSHWVLDFIVHRPDLPLYDNTMKVGLGLWNAPVVALALEGGLLLAGVVLYLRRSAARPLPMIALSAAMLAIHSSVFFGPPPASAKTAAVMAIAAYLLFAGIVWRLADRPARRARIA
jgi:hypothetical protein